MTGWIRWQAACVADDLRRWEHTWRTRCRRWWCGEPGRHSGWQDYTTGQMAAIETDLASRPRYTLRPAPALQGPPTPGSALLHDESLERLADDSFVAGI